MKLGPYDLGSVMHYPTWAFQRQRQLKTIIPKGDNYKSAPNLGNVTVCPGKAEDLVNLACENKKISFSLFFARFDYIKPFMPRI